LVATGDFSLLLLLQVVVLLVVVLLLVVLLLLVLLPLLLLPLLLVLQEDQPLIHADRPLCVHGRIFGEMKENICRNHGGYLV
jgi:hypothetical protein